jgi:hypothetical protein
MSVHVMFICKWINDANKHIYIGMEIHLCMKYDSGVILPD